MSFYLIREVLKGRNDSCHNRDIICKQGENIQDMEKDMMKSVERDKQSLSEVERANFFGNSSNGIALTIEVDEVVNYAIQQLGINIVNDVCIKNTTNDDLDNLSLQIDSDVKLVEKLVIGVQKLRAGEELHFRDIKVKINGDFLASLTERITCNLCFCVFLEDEVLASEAKDIIVLAFDQWPGLKYTPEILVSFSLPNHPVVTSLIQLASQYLEKWTGDPSLAGYQFDNPNRVKQMAAAAYAAIQQKNITYATPPSNFEIFGQRIRLADSVLDQHLGTCMDMTLLYVACLEAMGLNPIMVLVHGHIFAGVWLVEDSFSSTIIDDPSQLEKRMASGINELLVVECTSMNAGKNCDFDDAMKIAEKKVSNYANFDFVIDVTRARSMGMRPLPIRVMTDTGFAILHEERKEKDVTAAPSQMGNTFELVHISEKEKVTKQLQWERKLLDLSMRNMLINLRFTKAIVPLLCSNISILEDALTDGEEFHVLPRPDNMEINVEGLLVETLTNLGTFQDFIELESRHKKLHSFYKEKELNSCLTKLYRSAKTSMEENGANTLYLALGLLRWSEGNKGDVMRYAPIILMPIDIIRKSASNGYTMRMRDEDAQINITLLEFLKQNYDIQINGLSPLPTDDHGLDLPLIFAIIRRDIMSLPMWDVLEVGVIGNFSFSQFVMWNDIHSHKDMLERNNIIRSLIKGAVDWNCTIPQEISTDEAYLPITVDESQLRAINMAANDVSFVLHGPPGTGKSQTITAMIANALTKGKTVLFVAEKMAALEVVQKRLDMLGIGNFCLELHSNKATKKIVLRQLQKSLELGTYGIKTDYDQKIEDIRQMRADIDEYVKKLHERRLFGKSLKELIDIFETIPDYGKELIFSSEFVRTLSQNDLDIQRRSLEQLVATGKTLGHPHGHPLVNVRQTVYTQGLKNNFEKTIVDYKNSLLNLRDNVCKFVYPLNIKSPVSEQDWIDVEKYAKSVIYLEDMPSIFLNADNIDKEFYFPLSFLADTNVLYTRRNNLLRSWKESFLHADMNVYRSKYETANKKLLGRSRALSNLVSEIQSFAYFKIEVNQIPALLADIEMYQRILLSYEAKRNRLSFEWKQIIERYPSEQALAVYKENVKQQMEILHPFLFCIRQLAQQGMLNDEINCARNTVDAYRLVKEKEADAVSLLQLSFDDADGKWIDNRITICDCLINNASRIKDWVVYRQFDSTCRKIGLDSVCDAYEKGLPHEQVVSVYLRSIYKAIIQSVIESEPVLNSFTGSGFNERIIQFKKMDAEFMELTKEEMYYILTHNLPSPFDNVETSKELNILRRAISSNGRGMSIRKLFDQIPNILKKLIPCMLMSPISVAQYLDSDNEQYDIVIFDEASQLPTCKAVGVLARGKNAVIVGDPNQMPPTSFFAGNTIDEDNLDIEDLDSILDDCLALGMPSTHLHWHYRSRHESLIAFSNNEYYENSMLTFPSVNDREKRVSMVKVDGFYNRKNGRVNEGEAVAIVKEIMDRYKDLERKKQSIGVVTFNISQQTLIEDLLQEKFANDIAFDQWANKYDEPLFVKNLENVQGDERDVILFSVAFGPDDEGKLSMNFGPLNKEGGWKRLNVAVSRARSEMVVFSTMTSDMIDLKRTKSKGVESLKNFLEFAQKGKLHMFNVDNHEPKYHGILDEICKFLDNAGYKYQKNVGHSKFKVDIAVINPYNESEYLLGILLDGESYRQTTNTKDREVAQISILEGLGWSIYRIWTMDWWDDKRNELDKILRVLNENKKEALRNVREMSYNPIVQSETVSNSEMLEDVRLANEKEMVNENIVEREVKTLSDSAIFSESLSVAIDRNPSDLYESNQIENIAGDEKQKKVIFSEITARDVKRYSIETYMESALQIIPMSTTDFALKRNMPIIIAKLQEIIDIESPISKEKLVRKCLRNFDILRSSATTLEIVEKALKKVDAKSNKQNGVMFYWKTNQNPNAYYIYRTDVGNSERRLPEEICQQELKNAVCCVLATGGPLSKDLLVKDTVKIMGFSRSGSALVAAVERGIKFGLKTGELVRNIDNTISCSYIENGFA